MLTILIGDLALLVGLVVLLLPLLVTELSRPRDSFWGAVVLLLGLVLVTSNDRLRGSPMLAVLCGTFLIGRLGFEVAQSRWQKLSDEEQLRMGSLERWTTSFTQLRAVFESVGKAFGELIKLFLSKQKSDSPGKKWIRPDEPKTQESTEDLNHAPGEVISARGKSPGENLGVTSEQMSSSKDT